MLNHPGGVMIEPNVYCKSKLNIQNISFKNGTIQFTINEKNITVPTGYSESDINELYDLISNQNINYLYLDTNKQFTFICPEYLKPALFHVEFEICSLFSTSNKTFIGYIKENGKTIFGKPCIRSKTGLDFDELLFGNLNTISLQFSQIEKADDGVITVETDLNRIHHLYTDIIKKLSFDFDSYVKQNLALSKMNTINKIYQILVTIHKFSGYQIQKLHDGYQSIQDSFLFDNGVTKIVARPSFK